jgi:hypothetical protein
MRKTVFDHNVFWGGVQNQPPDANSILSDPKLGAPGSGGEGLDSLQGYRLLPGSPCIHAGAAVENNGARDFWGSALPAAGPPDIGAYQGKGGL